MSHLVVIEHEPGCPLDRFGEWLTDAHVDIIRPHRGEAIPSVVTGGLIVLGGQMSAYDDRIAPWLPSVRELLAHAVSAGTPTLGICLGAQLLAVACGGRVDVGAAPGREAGVVDVRWRPEAAADRLAAGLADPFPAPSMHADAVAELPDGAVWLASSATYPHQAFRVREAAWGVQFHPEVSLPTFRAWAEAHPEVDTESVTTELKVREEAVSTAGEALARRFISVVRGSS
jgi:GMP synthase (glutamine-hydrolysing)